MTTITPAYRSSAATARLTFAHVVRAEWLGLHSLRATVTTYVVGGALVLLAIVGMAVAWGFTGSPDAPKIAPPIEMLLSYGLVFAQIVGVLIGAAIYAKEHSTGSLRTQLAAAPRRAMTLLAKAVVVAVATFAWALVVFVLAALGAALVFLLFGGELTINAGPLVQAVLGGALLVALTGVLALGVAALVRSETWAVTLVLAFLLFLPVAIGLLPFEWAPTVNGLLFATASGVLTTPVEVFDGDAIRNVVLTIAWPAAALLGGMAVMTRRDA
ncbi:ABC-2 type transport system permease protein [Microbacterium resistens]|uniref:ABC-2 type transport system permease protein n=1 Tax=Microbacterium resistens TaxID=156977 RepID=A0ABU1SAF9_9MICO|nr:ABC transporter permease subunit [Microbacterium resistens]MDR6866556.1 ABC-2 type transport system permease protein [Microbacterium resistens]